jgi:hypothetical protein
LTENPSPPEPKTIAELLVGSWREVEPGENPNERILFSIVYHFRADGTFEVDVWDAMRGPKVRSGQYRVQGATLQILWPGASNLSPTRYEIWERTWTIESLTEEQLVIATVTKKRWSPEMARELAEGMGVPIDSVLSKVWEDHSRSVYVRIKGE